MGEPRTEVVEMLEQALEDACTGRLQAVGIIGLGDNERVICFSFDDDRPELEDSMLSGVSELGFEIVKARMGKRSNGVLA